MSFLEVDGKQIYYEVEGEGKPLVLVHSSLTHSGMYDAQMKAFAPRYKVIRYDQYGFGKSAFTDYLCAAGTGPWPGRPSRCA